MIRALLGILLLAVVASAQAPGTRLAKLRDDYEQDRLKLVKASASFDKQRERARVFVDRLQRFLDQEAKGLERYNARLMLVDFRLSLGERKRAEKTLRELDAKRAPVMILVGAAQFAGFLGLQDERQKWIDAAIANVVDRRQRG